MPNTHGRRKLLPVAISKVHSVLGHIISFACFLLHGYMSLLFIYVRIPLYQCSHLLLNVWHDCLACVKTWSDRVTKQAETKQAGT